MKRWGVALLVAVFVPVAPAAGAETIMTVNTVTTGGIGRVPISPGASAVEADSVYHQALSQAVGDALAQADALVAPTGQKLGPVDAIADNGGHVNCKNAAGESASYPGAEPDFGPTQSVVVAVAPTAPARTLIVVAPHKKTRKSRRARRAIARTAQASGAATCQVTSEVSLIVALEGS